MMRRVFLAVAVLLGLAASANAAVTANSPVTLQTPSRGTAQFTSSSSQGTYGTLYTAGSNGSRCEGLQINTNDPTATHLITIQLVNSTVKYGGPPTFTLPVSGGAGQFIQQAIMATSGYPGIWAGLPTDSDGNQYLQMVSGDTLQVTFATAITAGDVVNLQITCSDF